MSDISQLPDDLRALIGTEDAAAPGGNRAAIRDRVLTSVGAGVAAAAVAATPTTASAAAATTTASSAAVASGIAGKIVIVALTVGAIGGGTVLVTRDKPAARTHVGNAAPIGAPPAKRSLPPPAPSEQPDVVAAPVAVVPAPPPPPARVSKQTAIETPAAPPATPPTDDEPTLLHRAWDALGRNDTAAALSTVELDAKLYPAGALAEERDALRIDILLRLSRTAEARDLARAFAAHYPDSIHNDLITRALSDAPRAAIQNKGTP